MRKGYDFSAGERGKFYRAGAKLKLPIYLDEEILAFIQDIAARKKTDISSVVNQMLKGDIKLAEAIR